MRHANGLFALFLVVGCGSRTLDVAAVDAGPDSSNDGAPPVDFAKCDATTKCILAVPGCCGGVCGKPTLSVFVAIDAKQTDALRAATCTTPEPCPGCASRPDRNLVATCRTGECTGLDLRTDPISACATDADCRLRYAADCCECGATTSDLVAIATAHAADLDAILCAPTSTKCTLHCAPTPYPAGEKAICNTSTSHCEVSPPIP